MPVQSTQFHIRSDIKDILLLFSINVTTPLLLYIYNNLGACYLLLFTFKILVYRNP